MVRKQFSDFLTQHGASVVAAVSGNVTHLITTQSEVGNPTKKVLDAMKKGAVIVGEEYVQDCVAQGQKLVLFQED